LSTESCLKEEIDLKFNSEDTTSLSVSGEYLDFGQNFKEKNTKTHMFEFRSV
jgi:hypothetical protein